MSSDYTFYDSSLAPENTPEEQARALTWYNSLKTLRSNDPAFHDPGSTDLFNGRLHVMSPSSGRSTLIPTNVSNTPMPGGLEEKNFAFELYSKAKQGLLFIYPLGERYPHQITVGGTNDSPRADMTENLDSLVITPNTIGQTPLQPPAAPEISFLDRLLHFITFGAYHAEIFRQAERQQEQVRVFDSMVSAVKTVADEDRTSALLSKEADRLLEREQRLKQQPTLWTQNTNEFKPTSVETVRSAQTNTVTFTQANPFSTENTTGGLFNDPSFPRAKQEPFSPPMENTKEEMYENPFFVGNEPDPLSTEQIFSSPTESTKEGLFDDPFFPRTEQEPFSPPMENTNEDFIPNPFYVDAKPNPLSIDRIFSSPEATDNDLNFESFKSGIDTSREEMNELGSGNLNAENDLISGGDGSLLDEEEMQILNTSLSKPPFEEKDDLFQESSSNYRLDETQDQPEIQELLDNLPTNTSLYLNENEVKDLNKDENPELNTTVPLIEEKAPDTTRKEKEPSTNLDLSPYEHMTDDQFEAQYIQDMMTESRDPIDKSKIIRPAFEDAPPPVFVDEPDPEFPTVDPAIKTEVETWVRNIAMNYAEPTYAYANKSIHHIGVLGSDALVSGMNETMAPIIDEASHSIFHNFDTIEQLQAFCIAHSTGQANIPFGAQVDQAMSDPTAFVKHYGHAVKALENRLLDKNTPITDPSVLQAAFALHHMKEAMGDKFPPISRDARRIMDVLALPATCHVRMTAEEGSKIEPDVYDEIAPQLPGALFRTQYLTFLDDAAKKDHTVDQRALLLRHYDALKETMNEMDQIGVERLGSRKTPISQEKRPVSALKMHLQSCYADIRKRYPALKAQTSPTSNMPKKDHTRTTSPNSPTLGGH